MLDRRDLILALAAASYPSLKPFRPSIIPCCRRVPSRCCCRKGPQRSGPRRRSRWKIGAGEFGMPARQADAARRSRMPLCCFAYPRPFALQL